MLIKRRVRGHRAAAQQLGAQKGPLNYSPQPWKKIESYQESLKPHMGATDLKQLRQIKAKGLSMSLNFNDSQAPFVGGSMMPSPSGLDHTAFRVPNTTIDCLKF
jgi:hypothetical protein